MKEQNTITLTPERSRFHTFLLCCGITGSALFSIVNFTFAAVSPNYDIARQSIGDLELVSYGWVQSTNFVVVGLFMSAFAWGLRKELVNGPGAVLLPLLQSILGLIFILLGIFTHDPVHTSLSFVLFVAIMASFFLFTRRFSVDAGWQGWPFYTIISSILMMVLLMFYVLSRIHHGAYTGLFERGLLLTRVIWTLFFTVKLVAGVRLGPTKV
jgi:Protein of unknown function (DUF998)